MDKFKHTDCKYCVEPGKEIPSAGHLPYEKYHCINAKELEGGDGGFEETLAYLLAGKIPPSKRKPGTGKGRGRCPPCDPKAHIRELAQLVKEMKDLRDEKNCEEGEEGEEGKEGEEGEEDKESKEEPKEVAAKRTKKKRTINGRFEPKGEFAEEDDDQKKSGYKSKRASKARCAEAGDRDEFDMEDKPRPSKYKLKGRFVKDGDKDAPPLPLDKDTLLSNMIKLCNRYNKTKFAKQKAWKYREDEKEEPMEQRKKGAGKKLTKKQAKRRRQAEDDGDDVPVRRKGRDRKQRSAEETPTVAESQKKKLLKRCHGQCNAQYAGKKGRTKRITKETESDAAADEPLLKNLFEEQPEMRESPEGKESDKIDGVSTVEKGKAEVEDGAIGDKLDSNGKEKPAELKAGSSIDKLANGLPQEKINLFTAQPEAERAQTKFYDKFSHLLDTLTHYVRKCIECPKQMIKSQRKERAAVSPVAAPPEKMFAASDEAKIATPLAEQKPVEATLGALAEDLLKTPMESRLGRSAESSTDTSLAVVPYTAPLKSSSEETMHTAPQSRTESSVASWSGQKPSSATENINLFSSSAVQTATSSRFRFVYAAELKEKVSRMRLNDFYSLDSYFDKSELAVLLNVGNPDHECARSIYDMISFIENNAHDIKSDITRNSSLTVRQYIDAKVSAVDKAFNTACSIKPFVTAYADHLDIPLQAAIEELKLLLSSIMRCASAVTPDECSLPNSIDELFSSYQFIGPLLKAIYSSDLKTLANAYNLTREGLLSKAKETFYDFTCYIQSCRNSTLPETFTYEFTNTLLKTLGWLAVMMKIDKGASTYTAITYPTTGGYTTTTRRRWTTRHVPAIRAIQYNI